MRSRSMAMGVSSQSQIIEGENSMGIRALRHSKSDESNVGAIVGGTTEIQGKHYFGVLVQFDSDGCITITQSTVTTGAEQNNHIFIHKEQIPQLIELIQAGGKL